MSAPDLDHVTPGVAQADAQSDAGERGAARKAKAKPRKKRAPKITVLNIKILRRNDSRFWQAKITAPGIRKQITTRTLHPQAAKEFAELAYRHFARALKHQPSA